ncbi:hypothetical protein GCM10025771_22050 [Niveibacterium umoris]
MIWLSSTVASAWMRSTSWANGADKAAGDVIMIWGLQMSMADFTVTPPTRLCANAKPAVMQQTPETCHPGALAAGLRLQCSRHACLRRARAVRGLSYLHIPGDLPCAHRS